MTNLNDRVDFIYELASRKGCDISRDDMFYMLSKNLTVGCSITSLRLFMDVDCMFQYIQIYKQLTLKEVETFYKHEKGRALELMNTDLQTIITQALNTNDGKTIYKACKDNIGFATAISVLCLFRKINGQPILTTTEIKELAKEI